MHGSLKETKTRTMNRKEIDVLLEANGLGNGITIGALATLEGDGL